MNLLRYSLRLRLCIGLGLALVAVLGGAGWVVGGQVERHVVADFDRSLHLQGRQLAALCEDEKGKLEFDYVARFHPEFERDDDPDCYQIFLEDGTVAHYSHHLGPEQDLVTELWLDAEPTFTDHVLANGRRLRVVHFAFWPKTKGDGPTTREAPQLQPGARPGGRQLILAVARGRDHLDVLLASSGRVIFGAFGIALVIALVLSWWIVRRGMRPVAELASQVAALDAAGLEHGVELPWTPQELAPVADQINAFVARLRAAMQRERRFAGNVAHELRTPVAELRALAAVATRWPDDVESILGFFGDIRDIAGRMEGVIKNLLLLARCHAGRELLELTTVPLAALVGAAWNRNRVSAEAAGLTFVATIDANLVVRTDADKMAILWDNLIGNAISYALPGSTIRCAGGRSAGGGSGGGRFDIELSNQAEPLAAAELEKLAEPFWRRDEARSAADHAGLGLALVSAVADLLDHEVAFRQDDDGTFHVRVSGSVGWAAVPDEVRARVIRPKPPIRGEAS